MSRSNQGNAASWSPWWLHSRNYRDKEEFHTYFFTMNTMEKKT